MDQVNENLLAIHNVLQEVAAGLAAIRMILYQNDLTNSKELKAYQQAARLYIDEQTRAGVQLQNLLGLLSPGREEPDKA
jgi:hypothetical protein